MNIVFFVGLINLFLVPMLPVYFYYKKTGQPLKASLELLFQYSAATALIIPVAKVITLLPVHILHVSAPVESSYYTIAALAAAWLLPKLAQLLQNTSIKIEFKRNDERHSVEKNEDTQ